MPPKSQQKTPRHPKSAPRPIAPRPTEFTDPPSTAVATLPTPNGPAKSYRPLPITLTQKMTTLITLSRRLESILHGLNYGLFSTATEHRDAQARLKHLRGVYDSLHPQVDRELASLGYFPGTSNANTPHSVPPPKININSHTHTSHKHKYGPTSPQYTVDKALKRKADCQGRAASSRPPAKKQRVDGAESDFVETDCESVDEGSRKVDVQWPPEPITNLAVEVPLGEAEWAKMMGWSWGRAVRRVKREEMGEEWMRSPLGTKVLL